MDSQSGFDAIAGRRRSNPWVKALGVLLLTLTLAYAMWSLAEQNRALKEALAAISESGAARRNLVAGDPIPSIQIVDQKGLHGDLLAEVEEIGVIAFLTTTCRFCAETLPWWTELSERLDRDGIPFMAVSLHPEGATREYAATNEVSWRLWMLPDGTERAKLAVSSVPLTLVAVGGQVVEVWRGALRSDEVAAIHRAAIRLRNVPDRDQS